MKKWSTWFYLFAGLMIIILSSDFIIRSNTQDQIFEDINDLPYREYGLVLGASKNGKNGLNVYFKTRMDAAIALYSKGKIKKIIVSGDHHTHLYNEPKDMKAYLVDHGVPDSCIIMDFAGFRTLDSVVRSSEVFGAKSITIISQQFHNERAIYIANHHHIPAIAFNAQDTKSSNYTHLREYFARYLCLLDLYILNRRPKYL